MKARGNPFSFLSFAPFLHSPLRAAIHLFDDDGQPWHVGITSTVARIFVMLVLPIGVRSGCVIAYGLVGARRVRSIQFWPHPPVVASVPSV